MIYTVTFNPAVDYVMQVGTIIPDATNRAMGEKIAFGGKGVNVSRLLKEFGADTTALGFAAGFTGKALTDSLENDGVKTDFVFLKSGMTRINVKLKGAEETEINAAGPEILHEDLACFFRKLEMLSDGDWCVLAGSIPRGLSKGIYADIMKSLRHKDVRFVVDACGELLTETLEYRPYLIKPNVDELSQIAGRKLCDDDEIADLARQLQKDGAQNVLVSMGANGAILLDSDGKITRAEAYKINAVDTVGAGDSAVAGFIYGTMCGYDTKRLLNFACACGAATACKVGIALREDVENVLNTGIR
ncbi:MAG: 1-phosphofructokinase [Clostridia bacterium]|nr:1-phosphofructokinase [Clostridia bacterium]